MAEQDERWDSFIEQLREYVREHHHFPNKHTTLNNAVRYVRKRIKSGSLEEWKKEQFLEVAGMRDLTEHTGGRRKKSAGEWPGDLLFPSDDL